MRCDVCNAPGTSTQLETGPIVIETSVGHALSNSAWDLCDVCAEGITSGTDTTVRMYIRSHNTDADASNDLKEAMADLGIEVLNALRREHQAGAPLTYRS